MNNIFENAYFGKAYRTRDGQKAIYIKEKLVHEHLSRTDVLYAQLVLETGDILEVVKEIGVSNGIQPIYDNLDIVSEWEECNKKIPNTQECCKMFDIVDAYLCSVRQKGWTWEEAVQYIQEHWQGEEFNVNYDNIIKQYKTT